MSGVDGSWIDVSGNGGERVDGIDSEPFDLMNIILIVCVLLIDSEQFDLMNIILIVCVLLIDSEQFDLMNIILIICALLS